MKQTRKLLAMLLCIAMVLGMATTVFATETSSEYSITLKGDLTAGHTYSVYQIFTGDLHDGVLSNVVYGTGYVGKTAGVAVPDAELDALTDAYAFAKTLVSGNLLQNPVATLSATNNFTTSVEKAGYYLIVDEGGAANAEGDAVSAYIVKVVGEVDMTPKASAPTVDKDILDYDDEVDVNEAAIGEDVYYKITGTLPTTLADYKEYYYKFTDTLSKGLTYNNNLKVYVVNYTGEGEDKVANETEVTKYFHVNASGYNAENGTTITVTIGDILALNNVGITVNKDTQIVLKYTATVNENAVINGANPNVVDLTYSNDPNHSGDGTPDNPPEYPPENPGDEPGTDNPIGKTPESVVETYVTEVHIEKVDGEFKALKGASFEIYGTALKTVIVTSETFTEDENGTYWKLTDGTFTKDDPAVEGMDQTKYESTTVKYSVSVSEVAVETEEEFKASGAVGTDGKLTFTGLPAGTYTITEIETPDGYNTIGEIYLEVTFNADKTFSYKWTGAFEGTGDTAQVINQAGSTLPETGGIGTTLFYVFGGIMVLGAAVLLVTKKRMAA